jgi:hypothetical protein
MSEDVWRMLLSQTKSKHPLIIPKNSPISKLISRHYHQKVGHSGLEHVLSLIRERFWIIGARNSLKEILRRCVDCRRRQAAVGEQKMADLPEHRVTPDKPPFTFVGVDCFGPFLIKRAWSLVKRYGVLFTCLLICAVHIGVVLQSLDTSSSFVPFADSSPGGVDCRWSDLTSEVILSLVRKRFAQQLKVGTKRKSTNSSCNKTSNGFSTLP